MQSSEIDDVEFDEYEGMELSEIRAELKSKGVTEQKIKKIISHIDSQRIQKIYSDHIEKRGREFKLAGLLLLIFSCCVFFFFYLIGASRVFSIFILASAGTGYFLYNRGKTIIAGKNKNFHSHIRNSFNDIERL